ncbi:hypothetical protein RJZ56_004845 [Blastomyces dermatitidis]|uniref:Uncharacterized protein n=1 Tax=Ajellomyces dermatitidis (strain ER-3 / ATCC MYA-2586) TaxID=559297 RepID=A0ABX2VT56_AJEDR|nr:uncharacterized protein BDCG_02605 [Blastomyces dermatitidis ER-3]XP_045280108.1 hypothetical protein, variant [Blastomyces dermatitidis ER-3]EQL38225.1 hypothetical protein BDFG_00596 [Blastomyces dermatitidis ATCC 26199]EQL38226.1 hypothetical protein, variant [Blastomyces dermatitidis ATCC 26199]OAT00380.1 hypothetical protein BDCG_02605 [Blastomyces dermatitidis ER-3]OAT00381.1 hypothetical protein, variant [Blastomyces dermatitidis ER-3]
MAPIHKIPLQTRQTHVLPPRPANGPPGEAVPVTSFFRWKTLLWIMIATVCIFVLTVYFWKFGAFLRHFTSHRILDGNPKSTRYAKTWHGWVPLDKYERKKAWRKEKFRKFRRSVAWRSSHADYNWVWWDPKGAAMEQHFEDQKVIRWLPRWLKSYEHEKADLISKAHARNQTTRPSDGNMKRKPGLRHSMKTSAQVIKSRNRPLRRRLPLSLDGYSDGIIPSMLYNSLSRTSAKRGPYPSPSSRGAVRLRQGMVISLPAALNQQIPKPDFPHCGLRRCPSLSSLPQNLGTVDMRYAPEARRKTVSEGFQGDAVHSTLSSKLYEPHLRRVIPTDEGQINVGGPQAVVKTDKSLSWKYKAWAAKMQIHTFEQSPHSLHGLVGRPGSPLSGILKAMSSSAHHSEFSEHYNNIPAHNHGSGASAASISNPGPSKLHVLAPRIQRRAPRVHTSNISDASLDITPVDGILDVDRSPLTQNINQDNTMRHSCKYNTKHVQRQSLLPNEKEDISLQQPLHPTENKAVSFQLSKPHQNAKNGSWANPRPRLSDYEVELIYDLDRRLEWLSNEVEPGRKPFHFLLLANHWLNRATWIVLDPVSRVSPIERRTHGDPRFNRSLPEPEKDAVKRKYPVKKRVKLHAPRIDSWRLAINGARKSLGIQEFLKAVELFDGSADDPPDAAIDPASWILRKPPQGYERLDKELEVYYEGMCGWWEKLDDWQNVCRAYRPRKLVREGGANRQRMKEVARKATRPCRKVMKRGRNQGQNAPLKGKQREEQLAAREMRQVRSGSGSIPRRRRCQHSEGPRRPTIAGLALDTPENSSFVSISRSAGRFFTRESAHRQSSMGRSFALDGGQESGANMEALG